jgi:4,5-DOPA dioxygenase extradiol
METTTRQALFIGHGSPMNAVSSNNYTQSLVHYSKTIKSPKAIVVISAHWQTRGTFITGAEHPPQIYDFYGFPPELYKIKYEPSGNPETAHQIAADKIGITVDYNRGIDHAAWAVIIHMYPDQNIPVLEISLDVNKSLQEHFNLAKELIKYRKQNILFIGSGNLVHNLREIDFNDDTKPFGWAVVADQWFKERINSFSIDELINYTRHLPNHFRSVPTNEHYLPLLYTLGMKLPEEKITTLHESIQNGSISMRSIEIA